MEPTRERAWETLTRYTKSESLLRHALAVEASTAAYARKFGEDEELWRVAALLHDFDYEMHPTLDKHPQDGAPILREEGYPEEVVETVLSHAEHLALPRDTLLKKALFACDELSGFVHACALVRPTGLEGLEPKSVKKKLKQPSFAAGVHRDEVYKGAEELGVELDDHIRTIVAALQPIAARARPALLDGRRDSRDETAQVVLARPPAARDADEVAPRQLADDHAELVERRDERCRIAGWAEGDERGLVRRRHDVDERREQLAAAGGRPGGALVTPVRMHRERSLEAGERRRRRSSPSRTAARRPSGRTSRRARRGSRARTCSGAPPAAARGRARRARRRARARTATCGPRPCRSRPPRRRRGSRRPTGRRPPGAAARPVAGAARGPACVRSSRGRARRRSASFAGSPPRAARPRRPRPPRRGRRSRGAGRAGRSAPRRW